MTRAGDRQRGQSTRRLVAMTYYLQWGVVWLACCVVILGSLQVIIALEAWQHPGWLGAMIAGVGYAIWSTWKDKD